MIRPRPIRRWFTLLEMLIVTGLLGVVIAAAVMGVRQIMTAWDRLSEHSRRLQDILTLDRTLDSVLTNAIPFTWTDEQHTTYPVFTGDERGMTVAYLHRLNRVQDGAIRLCHLRQEDDELVCYYVERPPMPEELRADRVQRTVLAHGVDRVSFSYGDLEGEDFVFLDDWDKRQYLPMAFRIDVQWRDGEVETWLRRAAATSYYERYGKWEQKVAP